MSKPRHRTLKLLLLLLALSITTACWREPPKSDHFVPGEPLYERLTTQGTRTIFEGPQGPTLKIRARSHSTKIYDHEMRPVGKILLASDGQFTAKPTVGPPRTTQKIGDDIIELPLGWRLERTQDGLDIFSPDGELLGLLRHENDEKDDHPQWVLRPHYGAKQHLFVQKSSHQLHLLDHTHKPILSTSARQTPLILLATSLDTLPPLDRFTLALWLDQNLPAQPKPTDRSD